MIFFLLVSFHLFFSFIYSTSSFSPLHLPPLQVSLTLLHPLSHLHQQSSPSSFSHPFSPPFPFLFLFLQFHHPFHSFFSLLVFVIVIGQDVHGNISRYVFNLALKIFFIVNKNNIQCVFSLN